jgi:CBS domain-containing protein
MRAKDLMRRDVLTVREEDPVDETLDALVGKHIHGAPVVDAEGDLVGLVSQLDLHFGMMTRRPAGETAPTADADHRLRVGEIMTSPAVSAGEETTIADLCRMMHRLRLHRVPIVRGRKVTGVISSLDICGAIGRGEDLS